MDSIKVLANVKLQGSLQFSQARSTFPDNPEVGTLVVKDRCLYAYIEVGGITTWYPFSDPTTAFTLKQDTPVSTWTVNHGFNMPISELWYLAQDTTGASLWGSITVVDSNTFTLEFAEPQAGAILVVAPYHMNATSGGGSLTPDQLKQLLADNAIPMMVFADWAQGVNMVAIDGVLGQIQLNDAATQNSVYVTGTGVRITDSQGVEQVSLTADGLVVGGTLIEPGAGASSGPSYLEAVTDLAFNAYSKATNNASGSTLVPFPVSSISRASADAEVSVGSITFAPPSQRYIQPPIFTAAQAGLFEFEFEFWVGSLNIPSILHHLSNNTHFYEWLDLDVFQGNPWDFLYGSQLSKSLKFKHQLTAGQSIDLSFSVVPHTRILAGTEVGLDDSTLGTKRGIFRASLVHAG